IAGGLPFTSVPPRSLWPITALEVYTSKEVDALNGTNLRLKCTFSSSSPISPQLSVTWNFQPEDLSSHEPVFYYLKEPYKLSAGRFKGRATWDGNIERYDVSIVIWNLQPTDNGTFTCQVKNPPDVDGTIGEVRLRVVQKGERPRTPPEVMSLASAEHQLVFLHVWKNKKELKKRLYSWIQVPSLISAALSVSLLCFSPCSAFLRNPLPCHRHWVCMYSDDHCGDSCDYLSTPSEEKAREDDRGVRY
uniref:Myelin protein zero like 2 n=1 Tax=Anser cygnoides TaxID=8845 RepID=A0A8B9EBW7_ANSCY